MNIVKAVVGGVVCVVTGTAVVMATALVSSVVCDARDKSKYGLTSTVELETLQVIKTWKRKSYNTIISKATSFAKGRVSVDKIKEILSIMGITHITNPPSFDYR